MSKKRALPKKKEGSKVCFKSEVFERAKGEEERKNRKKKEKSFSSVERKVTSLESVLSSFFFGVHLQQT